MWKSLCFAIFWQILCNFLRFLTKVTPKIFQRQPGKETIVFFVDGCWALNKEFYFALKNFIAQYVHVYLKD